MGEKAIVAPATQPVAPAPVAPSQPVAETSAPAAAPVITIDVLAGALRQMTGEQQAQGQTALAGALTEAINATKPKAKITVANRTKFNPNNPTNRVRRLKQKFFQNYFEVDVDEMTDEVFDLLNSGRLKQGQFVVDARIGPLLEVVNVKRGSQIGLHLRYNNAKPDQRMMLDARCPGGLAGYLRACIKEAEEQAERRRARREAGLDDEDE
jgi:hypothetical protein